MWHVKLFFCFFLFFLNLLKIRLVNAGNVLFNSLWRGELTRTKSVNYLVCAISVKRCCPMKGWPIKKGFHKYSFSLHRGRHPLDRPNKGSFESWMYFLRRSWIASSRRSFCRFPRWAASILIRLVNSESRVVLYIFLFPIRVILDQKGPLDE